MALLVLIGVFSIGKRAGVSEAEGRLAAGGDSAMVSAADERERRVVSAIGKSLNAPKNLQARIAELGQTGDPIERLEGFLAVAASLRVDEFKETIEAYINVGTWEKQSTELGILLQSWAEVDPEAAVKFISERGLPENVRANVLMGWAKSSPDEALAFARKNYRNNPVNPTNTMLMGVINGLAQTDPERATALISELPKGKPRSDALRSTVLAVMEGGLDSAIQWSDGIADDNVNAEAVKLILRNVATHDPERAAELMPEMGGSARGAADRIALALAKSDVDRAMAWTRELEGEGRNNAARGIVMALSKEDPHRAVEYLESMRGTTDLSVSATAFAWGASLVEPALASEWIREVSNPAEQHRMYHHILSRWKHDDSESASQWIAANAEVIPPDVLADLTAE